MKTIPFGYELINGKAEINDTEASILHQFFTDYLSGLSLTNAAKKAGFTCSHGSAKRILMNKHYLGDDFYPAIISPDIFKQAEYEIQKRAAQLGRLNRKGKGRRIVVPTHFKMPSTTNMEFKDFFNEAQYLYGLIEEDEHDEK